jgi:hypothetical protein
MPYQLDYQPPRRPSKMPVMFWVVVGLIALFTAALGPAIIIGP